MSETMSISASACAIFCSEEIWGFCPKNIDMLADDSNFSSFFV
jgi:hypothetical protein